MTAPTAQQPLHLTPLRGRFAVCRLAPDAPVPAGLAGAAFTSITRTETELSIVCPEDRTPEGAATERGWVCLAVRGPLPFSATGVLASIAGPLAEARISIFAISTFDTDYVLVKASDAEKALVALEKAGHSVSRLDPEAPPKDERARDPR